MASVTKLKREKESNTADAQQEQKQMNAETCKVTFEEAANAQ